MEIPRSNNNTTIRRSPSSTPPEQRTSTTTSSERYTTTADLTGHDGSCASQTAGVHPRLVGLDVSAAAANLTWSRGRFGEDPGDSSRCQVILYEGEIEASSAHAPVALLPAAIDTGLCQHLSPAAKIVTCETLRLLSLRQGGRVQRHRRAATTGAGTPLGPIGCSACSRTPISSSEPSNRCRRRQRDFG